MKKNSKDEKYDETKKIGFLLEVLGIGVSLISLGYVFINPIPNFIAGLVLIALGMIYLGIVIFAVLRRWGFESTLRNLASIATIISLWVAIIALLWGITSFKTEIDIQHTIELNEHISDIQSLRIELEKNIDLMNQFINNPSLLIEKHLFERLVIENIEERVSDGKISNRILKSHIIKTHFQETGINNLLEYINSPEMLENKQKKRDLGEQLIENLKDKYGFKENTLETLNLIKAYEICLNNEKSIEICNNDVIFIKADKQI